MSTQTQSTEALSKW